MSVAWEAPAARAVGLATHLLDETRLRAIERTETLAELAHELRDTPYTRYLPGRSLEARAFEVGVTRSFADRMGTLARWAPPDALAPVFLEEDARTVRAIVRGVVGALTPEQRVAGALPTPTLGRRALETLSHAESVGSVAATLTEWRHPLGPALLEEAGRSRPDLLRLEVALVRRLAEVRHASARSAGREMVAFVRQGIDADNVATALLLVGARMEGDPVEYFVEGGMRLVRGDFERAARAPDREQSAALLARAVRDSALAGALMEGPFTASAVAARILAARVDDLVRRSRLDPLTALPVLLFVLRLRREAELVRRALWLAALGGRRRA